MVRLLKRSSLEEHKTAVRALMANFLTEILSQQKTSQSFVFACARSLLPSLNDVDPGAAQAGAEALLVLVNVCAGGCSDLVSCLLTNGSRQNAPQSESSFVESKSEEKTSKKDKTTKTDGKGSGKALTVSPLVDALQEMPS